ncbi:M14 family metallocarboxypeptidase [Horticoccus luteus]|uniref:M14 family metallocarboxypeptidase n=2 Tax=Horticoccus luteus TaxID=2862869 RepID=A0A8F9TZ30_9BACT|nr:M14 family metallocarboxypeptidase [Horticoccus luteus]
MGSAAGVPLLALTRRTSGPRPRIYLSAGIHGDEPAPPHALLRLLETGVFDARATWFVCPLLNPAGFVGGTREGPLAIDLNRDYLAPRSLEIQAHTAWLARQPPFDLALCLHEDWEATGFYLYELNAAGQPTLAPAILAAAGATCPIDLADLIDGRAAQGGLIRPLLDPAARPDWPEALYLRAHHTSLTYTLESASRLPLEERVATLVAAVQAAVKALTVAPRKTPPNPGAAAL